MVLHALPVDQAGHVGCHRQLRVTLPDLQRRVQDLLGHHQVEALLGGDHRSRQGGRHLQADQRAERALRIHAGTDIGAALRRDPGDARRLGDADAARLDAQRGRAAIEKLPGILRRGAVRVHQDRDRAGAAERGEFLVRMEIARVLGDLGALGGDHPHIAGGVRPRIGAVGIDVEVDRVADHGLADPPQRRLVDVGALAALDLQRAKSMPLDHLRGLARHQVRGLARHAPAQLDRRRAVEDLPQRPAGRRGAQGGAGIVDQHLGEMIFRIAGELPAHRVRVGGVDLLHGGEQQVIEHGGDRTRRDPGPGRLEGRFRHAGRAVVGDHLQQHEARRGLRSN